MDECEDLEVNPGEKSVLPLLPLSRIRTIMKSSPDMCALSQESVFLMTKAAELFIEQVMKMAHEKNKASSEVDYGDLAEVVNDKEHMDFLHDIVPPKITVKEYYELLEQEESFVVVI